MHLKPTTLEHIAEFNRYTVLCGMAESANSIIPTYSIFISKAERERHPSNALSRFDRIFGYSTMFFGYTEVNLMRKTVEWRSERCMDSVPL